MIRLILDKEAAEYEQDLRELTKQFYPGEDFEIHTPDGVHLSETTQEEKNALKKAQESGTAARVNRKSAKNRSHMVMELTPEGAADDAIRLSLTVHAAELPLTGDRRTDKSMIKALAYQKLTGLSGKTLPWGDLTGIRPVSLVSPMMEQAMAKDPLHHLTEEDRAAIRQKISKEYMLEGEKLELVMEIAEREQQILGRILAKTGRSYQEGWSLYIGIPFCPTRCLYCSFLSNTIDHWESRLPLYFEHLASEIRLAVSEMSGRLGKTLQTIYIGGGTPTALNAFWLKRLMELVHEECDFSGVVEFTVEAGRPDSIDREKLEILKAAGVDRISVNPQTFQQKTLELIGRKHSVEETIAAYRLAREVGFDNINMDIILGLPGEKLPEVTDTLCEIARLKPDSLTVHTLAVKRAARLTLERDYWAGVYRAGDEQEIVRETELAHQADQDAGLTFRYPEITRMMMAAEYTAALLDLKPYYLYRQKNMAGNLENVGYCLEGKECLYNILMMEEKHSVIGCGAGTSTKLVLPDKDGISGQKRVERCDNGKSIGEYMDHFEKYKERKLRLFKMFT